MYGFKKFLLIVAVVFSPLSLAQQPVATKARGKVYRAGAGVILGTVTGLSGNYRLTKSKSIDAALSFDLDDDEFTVYSTYLWHSPGSLDIDNVPFGWYLGLGAMLETVKKHKDTDFEAGPRGSIGLHFPIRNHRFDVFLEGALVMKVIPETEVEGHLGLGGRIYF